MPAFAKQQACRRKRFALRFRFLPAALILALVLSHAAAARADDSPEAATNARLSRTVLYLSSDELEGRGLGSKGLDLAADYIAQQFKDIGLKTDLYDGTPFQRFTTPAASPHAAPPSDPGSATTSSATPPPPPESKRIDAKNVIAVLEGEGPHADETIVIGAITIISAAASPAPSNPAPTKFITAQTTTLPASPPCWKSPANFSPASKNCPAASSSSPSPAKSAASSAARTTSKILFFRSTKPSPC